MGEKTVTFSEYLKEHTEFANRHVATGFCGYQFKQDGEKIMREFRWDDGAFWHEETEQVIEKTNVETHGLIVKANVKLWKTTYWSSENHELKCFYEQD